MYVLGLRIQGILRLFKGHQQTFVFFICFFFNILKHENFIKVCAFLKLVNLSATYLLSLCLSLQSHGLHSLSMRYGLQSVSLYSLGLQSVSPFCLGAYSI